MNELQNIGAVAALETRGLSKSFGALRVANTIDFRLEHGARHALIGPNGAGKTSFVNLVTGVLQPGAGQILLDGIEVTALPQAARAKRGLVRTFQITQLFRGLSVLENVTLAVCERRGVGGARPGITAPRSRRPSPWSSAWGSPPRRCARSARSPTASSV